MKTLIEFITFTKGVEYLLAIAFLLAFVAFWQIMQRRGKASVLKAAPVLAVALAIGALALITAAQGETTTAAPQVSSKPLLASPVLVEMYGPASFDHEAHQELADDCAVCHHHSEGTYPPCRECHDTAFDPENLNKPGIGHVYHLRCISCHTEQQAGPVECTGCHDKATVPPLPVTHPLTGNGNCLSCHGESISGVPAMPADHGSATNGVCPICHQTARPESEMATKALPHAVTGHENCLLCHGEGIGGATRVPADHTGRTDETCQVCHKPEQGVVTVSKPNQPAPEEATPTIEQSTGVEAETVVAKGAGGEEPASEEAATDNDTSPHADAGHDLCLLCYLKGVGDTGGVPEDHAGRSEDTCQMCHQPPE